MSPLEGTGHILKTSSNDFKEGQEASRNAYATVCVEGGGGDLGVCMGEVCGGGGGGF